MQNNSLAELNENLESNGSRVYWSSRHFPRLISQDAYATIPSYELARHILGRQSGLPL